MKRLYAVGAALGLVLATQASFAQAHLHPESETVTPLRQSGTASHEVRSVSSSRATGIVFISDRDSPSSDEVTDEVYLYDTSTGRTSRLTTNTIAESFPQISPDGRYLSYLGNTGIDVCPLTFTRGGWSCGPARGVVSNPAPTGGRFVWTPDGRSIVYGGLDPVGGDVDVFSVTVSDLRPARNLTQERAGEQATFDGQPSVSPDGRFFAYGHSTTGGGDLYRRRIDGSHPVALTSTPTASEFGPAYSPDGSQLAFHSNRPGPANFDIYVMRPRPESTANPAIDLTDEVRAADGTASFERFPTWSPTGAKIAFWWHVTPQGFADGEIYTMRADGSHPQNLTANNPTDSAAQPVGDIMPSWGTPRRL
jgi:Tol biopolymer transport system component